MNMPVEIHFHGLDKSEAVEARVREKVAKLEKYFSRMTSCRVVLDAAQRNLAKPKVYQLKIEIGVPKRRPIIVRHERIGGHASEELNLAIRDAFEAALRKLDGMASKIGQRSKLDRGRRRPGPERGGQP
jgi:ribosome-associated translation inhibitor RaiA